MRLQGLLKTTKEWDGELPGQVGVINETLVRHGIVLAAEGVQPSSKGTRISYARSRPVVADGPFAETKERLAGCRLRQARSKEGSAAYNASW